MARLDVDFGGTHLFVAGGTSGINLGIAEGFAAAGARVAVDEPITAARSTPRSRGFAPWVPRRTGGAADVRDPDATSAVLHGAHAAFGDIDVLVSGAAGDFLAAAVDMSPNAFRSVVVEIDLLGSFHVLRAAYPLLRKPGAVVINVSAPQAFLPMELQAHVCAAKAGVDMLIRVLALEWEATASGLTLWFPARSREPKGWTGWHPPRRPGRSSCGRCQPDDGVRRVTSPTRACCWHRRGRATSPGLSCLSMAAGRWGQRAPRWPRSHACVRASNRRRCGPRGRGPPAMTCDGADATPAARLLRRRPAGPGRRGGTNPLRPLQTLAERRLVDLANRVLGKRLDEVDTRGDLHPGEGPGHSEYGDRHRSPSTRP